MKRIEQPVEEDPCRVRAALRAVIQKQQRQGKEYAKLAPLICPEGMPNGKHIQWLDAAADIISCKDTKNQNRDPEGRPVRVFSAIGDPLFESDQAIPAMSSFSKG